MDVIEVLSKNPMEQGKNMKLCFCEDGTEIEISHIADVVIETIKRELPKKQQCQSVIKEILSEVESRLSFKQINL